MVDINMGIPDDWCQGNAEHLDLDDDSYELPAEDRKRKPRSVKVAREK